MGRIPVRSRRGERQLNAANTNPFLGKVLIAHRESHYPLLKKTKNPNSSYSQNKNASKSK